MHAHEDCKQEDSLFRVFFQTSRSALDSHPMCLAEENGAEVASHEAGAHVAETVACDLTKLSCDCMGSTGIGVGCT